VTPDKTTVRSDNNKGNILRLSKYGKSIAR